MSFLVLYRSSPACLFAPLVFADDSSALQIHTIYLQKYTMYIYVVLCGVLALVVFADDSSD